MGANTSNIIIIAILAVIWLGIAAFRKELRKELLVSGLFTLLLLPAGFTLTDSVELSSLLIVDLLFCFFAGGLAATLFHVIFGKHYHRIPSWRPDSYVRDISPQSWILKFVGLILGYAWLTIILSFVFQDQHAFAFLVSGVAMVCYMALHRKDLIIDSIVSGLLMTSLVFVSSLVATQLEPVTSTNTILGVPSSLLVWSLGIGLVLGPAYEYVRRLTIGNVDA